MPFAKLIYNPAAGRYPSWILTERAANVLREEGWRVSIEKTQSGKHVTDLAEKAALEGMDALFVVGGDGSVNRALPGLINSQTALGVLPAGTANVWAQELGLPGLSWTRWMALEESARRLAGACVAQADVGFCNGIPFLLWAGIGLDAFIVQRLEPRTQLEKRFAVVHYVASAAWNASMWRGMNLNVVIFYWPWSAMSIFTLEATQSSPPTLCWMMALWICGCAKVKIGRTPFNLPGIYGLDGI
jgi:diacylglycerol kinase (ATP)